MRRYLELSHAGVALSIGAKARFVSLHVSLLLSLVRALTLFQFLNCSTAFAIKEFGQVDACQHPFCRAALSCISVFFPIFFDSSRRWRKRRQNFKARYTRSRIDFPARCGSLVLLLFVTFNLFLEQVTLVPQSPPSPFFCSRPCLSAQPLSLPSPRGKNHRALF